MGDRALKRSCHQILYEKRWGINSRLQHLHIMLFETKHTWQVVQSQLQSPTPAKCAKELSDFIHSFVKATQCPQASISLPHKASSG